jgi:hypothetical protein
VVAGTTSPDGNGTVVTLTGRNFLPGSTVGFTRTDNRAVTRLTPQFVSSTSLKATLPDDMVQAVQRWDVAVTNGTVQSNSLAFRAVAPGTPVVPTLAALSPAMLPSTSSDTVDTWITLNGSDFKNGDSVVKTSSIPTTLTTQFVSSTQLRALVPGWWLAGPKTVRIHVESATDPDTASEEQVLQVSNDVGSLVDPPDPVLNTVNDGFVPLLPSSATSPAQVDVFGEGFQPGTQVVATVDDVDMPLQTTVLSASHLQAVVPNDFFGADPERRGAEAEPDGQEGQAGQGLVRQADE